MLYFQELNTTWIINISISFSSTVTIPFSANKIWFQKVSKEILKLVLIYVTIPRSLIFLFFGNTKTIYFIFCIIYQNIILRIQVDMILTSLVSHFIWSQKEKPKITPLTGFYSRYVLPAILARSTAIFWKTPWIGKTSCWSRIYQAHLGSRYILCQRKNCLLSWRNDW